MKRLWTWIVGGLALMAVIAGTWMVVEREKKPARGVIDVPELTTEEKERRELDQLMASGLLGLQGSTTLQEGTKTPQGWFLGLNVETSKPQLTEVFERVIKIGTEIKRLGMRVDTLSMTFITQKLRDVYGRVMKDTKIAKVSIPGSHFHKVEWDHFEPTDLPKIASEYWLHEDLRVQHEQMAEAAKKRRQSASEGEAGGAKGTAEAQGS